MPARSSHCVHHLMSSHVTRPCVKHVFSRWRSPKKNLHPTWNLHDPRANMTQNCGLVVENYEFSRCGVKIPNRVLFLIFLWFKLTKFWIKLTELIKFRQRLQKSMDHDGSWWIMMDHDGSWWMLQITYLLVVGETPSQALPHRPRPRRPPKKPRDRWCGRKWGRPCYIECRWAMWIPLWCERWFRKKKTLSTLIILS